MSSRSAPHEVTEINLKHIYAELRRIDLLIQHEVRRWQLAGQDFTDAFRGLHVSDAEAERLIERPPGASWGQTVLLPPDEERAFARAQTEAIAQLQAILSSVQQQGRVTRLQYLVDTFELDRYALDIFLLCLAPALDLRYERLYAYLQDDVTRKQPTVNLILNLLGQPGLERLSLLTCFTDESPLFKYRLLERGVEPGAVSSPTLNTILSIDPTVVSWLLGHYQPSPELAPYASLFWPETTATDTLLAGEIGSELTHLFPMTGQPPLVIFYGPDRTGQEAAARLLVSQMKRPILRVNMAAGVETGPSIPTTLNLVLRDARLTGAVPFLTGWDSCLSGEEGPMSPPRLLAALCAYPDLVIVSGQREWQARGLDRERPLFRFEFPVPGYTQRHVLWHHFLGRLRPSATHIDLTALAGQFALTSDQIRDAVVTARDWALQQNRELSAEDLFAAARSHSNPRLTGMAHKILPRYTWEDIILPDEQMAILHEIVDAIRTRPLVMETWGVGRKLAAGQGITILFAGPPGTGKTMAAEIIAGELGLDLYKIDLSTVISKYIGETEKNLERIFNEAQSSNAILFFDEADAIFGKRSEVKDAHDRYANIEISYLLQRMEAYDGVTILATNLRANLDEAFTRRLQFAVDFPFPDETDRLRIWQSLFPSDVPCEANLDFGLLARRFKLTGGNIRNIIVSAAHLAAADGKKVAMQHLLHGVRRELQKMGRLINETDFHPPRHLSGRFNTSEMPEQPDHGR